MPDNCNSHGSAINEKLRERVMSEMNWFMDALDDESAAPGARTLDGLRDATDGLMRALGRVIIEIKRGAD